MKQKFPLISIVVPMYNSSKYISRCIISIINQDYGNFEVLLVDDHSIDDTIQICQKYINDSRIKVIINSGKKGASSARNLGIKESLGNFITFVDSDDIIAPNYLSTLYRIAVQYPNHLAICGYTEFSDSTLLFKWTAKKNIEIIPANVIISNIFYYHSSAGACLFKSNLVTQYNISMEEDTSFNEDVFFTCKYLSICEGAAITDEKLYGYYVNPDGIGAHKAHSDLTIRDVNHRAKGYIALQNALQFTKKNAPDKSKYMLIGYTFIAAEVKLTAARAGVKKFDFDKEINKFLSIKNRASFCIYSKSLRQILLVNGVAISPRLIKFILDDLKLLALIK